MLPLRLQPGVGMPLLADVQWVGLTEPETADAEPWLARLLVGLRGVGLDPAGSIAWDLRRSPYPGLVPFASEDAAVFFGRRSETHRLVELLTPTLQHGPGRMVAVVGPRGSPHLGFSGLPPVVPQLCARHRLAPVEKREGTRMALGERVMGDCRGAATAGGRRPGVRSR